MIEVYTDASVSNGKAVTSCIVLDPKTFIGYNVKHFSNVSSSLQGELLGIREALKYVVNHTEPASDIIIYCDSNAALELVNLNDDTKPVRFTKIITDIRKYKSIVNVKFQLIKGHQSTHNPNKVVDLISNSVLRTM